MRSLTALCLILGLAGCAGLFGGSGPPYFVFFTENSASIPPEAQQLVARAAASARAQPAAEVTVIGYANRTGAPQAEIDLSEARARAVTQLLMADGVPEGHITQQGGGQSGDINGVGGRRVEIRVGG